MNNYAKIQEKVTKAKEELQKAEEELRNFSRKKCISPEEIVEEMERMGTTTEWEDFSAKQLGQILVQNIFQKRDNEAQQWKDDQRDY